MLSALSQFKTDWPSVPASAATEFVAGYLYNLNPAHSVDYFRTCFIEDQYLADTLNTAFEYLADQQYEEEIGFWAVIMPLITTDIAGCSEALSTFDKLKQF